jgi:hypothetical protein
MTVPSPRRALTAEEEVTLRRIAFGESPARTLRAHDLKALRGLKLIQDHRDGPMLTAEGRKVFDELPRPSAQSGSGPYDAMLTELSRVTGRK